jgi:hypothetical protein
VARGYRTLLAFKPPQLHFVTETFDRLFAWSEGMLSSRLTAQATSPGPKSRPVHPTRIDIYTTTLRANAVYALVPIPRNPVVTCRVT